MLKPVRWNTFLRDFLVIQIGFALFGLAIATMIRSNLGTSPWALLEVAISKLTGITPGRMSIIVGFAVLLVALALREKVGWGPGRTPVSKHEYMYQLAVKTSF